MPLVVADAGPIHYLVLIGQINILPTLFETIFLPSIVRDELTHDMTPPLVREWLRNPPAWLEVRQVSISDCNDALLLPLDDGERAAITLASSIGADLVLIDDREGVKAARKKGFAVAGTLGVLDLGARLGLLNLPEAFTRLKATNFRYRRKLMDDLLAQRRSTEG